MGFIIKISVIKIVGVIVFGLLLPNLLRGEIFSNYDTNSVQRSTHYELKNVQIGSAHVPLQVGRAHIEPDPNKTKNYLVKIDTTVIKPTHKHFRKLGHRTRPKYQCVKCPTMQTVIAQRRLDGVLIEPPPAYSCRSNRPYSAALYNVQTLFGANLSFVLPEGSHSFIGRILNKKTNTIVHSCLLKYKVVVRQCPKYHPTNKNIRVKCDLGNIWGSECRFSCRNNRQLTHENSVLCGDDLKWQGDEPNCVSQDDFAQVGLRHIDLPQAACELPLPPDNGKLSCSMSDGESNGGGLENALMISSGTTCFISCSTNYFTPSNIKQFIIFHCFNGQWNSTMFDFCHPLSEREEYYSRYQYSQRRRYN